VTRVFSSDRDLYIYLQAYATNTVSPGQRPPTLVAYVTLYHDQQLAFRSPALSATPIPSSRLGTIPFSFALRLGAFPQGEYQAQVTVLDGAGQRATFWQGQLLLSH